MSPVAAVEVKNLSRRYGERLALVDVSLTVHQGEVFALLGPNGSGKTTLFKILSTLLPATSGEVVVFGDSVRHNPAAVRTRLGVVFQSPSLDPKLTVNENLQHHGHLYGLRGAPLRTQMQTVLARMGLTERTHDLVATLSGGLQRRVELAKGMLHKPDILILDEPSTGLDPGARRDFNAYIHQLRQKDGVTVILTTHILEEAERCDRVAILHQSRLVALDTPEALKARVGGDIIAIRSSRLQELRDKVASRFACSPVLVDGTLRVQRPRGHEFVRDVVEAFPGEIEAVTFGRPTLEDVFIHETGQQFWSPEVNGGGTV